MRLSLVEGAGARGPWCRTVVVMSADADRQGGTGLTDQEKQDFETTLSTARRAADVDGPPALTDDDGPEEGGGEAEPVDSGVLEDDDEAWEASVVPARVPVAAKAVPAGVPRRLAAALLDAVLSLAAAGVVLLVSELLWLRSQGAVSVPVWVPVLVFFAAGWVHTLVGEGLCAGVTVGKRVLGLRVVGGGGHDPALWRVAARRACLDAVVLAVTALALWLTMVRQYGGLPPGTPVELDGSDVTVFCAFFVNLVVLLGLGRHLDPKRRFPHDSLAGLAVVCTVAAVAGQGPAAGSGRRRVAAPVGVVRSRWDDETAEVVPARPWDGRKWRADPAAAAKAVERERARMGPVSRLIDRAVAWGQGPVAASSGKAADAGSKEASSGSGGARRVGAIDRLADRVVAWSEGETALSSRGAEKDSTD